MSKELEEAIERLKRDKRSPLYDGKNALVIIKDLDIVLEALDYYKREYEVLQLQLHLLREEANSQINNSIPKEKIENIIKEELPDDETCATCDIYDVNGVEIKKKLQELLEGK